MRRRWIIGATIFGAGLAVLVADQWISVTSPRPLNDASMRLERIFGAPVTYEESVRVWPGELASRDGSPPKKWGGLIPPKWDLYPKMQTFRMPVPDSDLEQSVRRTVDAFNQTADGIRFDVLRSKYGLHIVQRRIHNENGGLVDARSLLDARITIPTAARTPYEHLLSLEGAVTAATGTKLAVAAFNGHGFDNLYSRYSISSKNSWRWGTESVVARQALIDLLDRAKIRFSWRLNCQSSSQAVDRMCALNLGFVEGTNPNELPR